MKKKKGGHEKGWKVGKKRNVNKKKSRSTKRRKVTKMR